MQVKIPENVVTNMNGNAFMVMGVFQKYARKQGEDAEAIKAVIDEMMESDYDHLLQTFMKNVELT